MVRLLNQGNVHKPLDLSTTQQFFAVGKRFHRLYTKRLQKKQAKRSTKKRINHSNS